MPAGDGCSPEAIRERFFRQEINPNDASARERRPCLPQEIQINFNLALLCAGRAGHTNLRCPCAPATAGEANRPTATIHLQNNRLNTQRTTLQPEVQAEEEQTSEERQIFFCTGVQEYANTHRRHASTTARRCDNQRQSDGRQTNIIR